MKHSDSSKYFKLSDYSICYAVTLVGFRSHAKHLKLFKAAVMHRKHIHRHFISFPPSSAALILNHLSRFGVAFLPHIRSVWLVFGVIYRTCIYGTDKKHTPLNSGKNSFIVAWITNSSCLCLSIVVIVIALLVHFFTLVHSFGFLFTCNQNCRNPFVWAAAEFVLFVGSI